VYAVSDKFLNYIGASGRIYTVVDLYTTSSSTPTHTNLPVVSGSVQIDRTSDVRGSGSLVIADLAVEIAPLLPVGAEIRIRSGFQYPDGTQELVPLGVFPIEDITFNEGSNNTITIEFFDRGQALADLKPMEGQDLAGMTYGAVLQAALDDTFTGRIGVPSLVVDPSFDVTQKMPGGTKQSGSWLDTIKKVCDALGAEQYMDRDGNLQIVPVPTITPTTPESSAVWTIAVRTNMVEAQRKILRTNSFNAVAITGAKPPEDDPATLGVDESKVDTIFSLQQDTDPTSITFYGGPFGKKILHMENELLLTTLQAEAAALAKLKAVSGLAKTIQFKSLVNTALYASDIILFKYFGGDTELHLIDQITIDFASGEMQGNTRTQELVS